jgi:chemotaxis protein histidine kinase CheA
MIENINSISEIIEQYENIHDNVLGRGKEQSGGDDSVYQDKLQDILDRMSLLSVDKIDNTKKAINEIQSDIFNTISKDINNILNTIMKSLSSIAGSLEKEVPELKVSGDEIRYTKEESVLLKNIFTHILRNSIDHGLETIDDRKKKKKSARGIISINCERKGNFVKLAVSDDGAGLNVEKIYRKAKELNLLEDGTEYGPKELADFIFHSGFSTAQKVTDISGRGVGMDAVRSFLVKQEGNISINITSKDKDQYGCVAFSWEILVPLNAFNKNPLKIAS